MSELIIDKETYKLTKNNYCDQITNKKRIVIGNTYNSDMKHYKGWLNRWNGKYSKTAMFTIDVNGDIYQHFSPNNFSNFLDNFSLNETTISILLENEGWLTKSDEKDLGEEIEENKYLNYIGHIYNRKDSVIEKRWRNHKYWAPYTKKQQDSTIKLVNQLCHEFDIPKNVINHNTNFDNVEKYNGILYKSNFEKYYTDVSPAWDCLGVKKEVEL